MILSPVVGMWQGGDHPFGVAYAIVLLGSVGLVAIGNRAKTAAPMSWFEFIVSALALSLVGATIAATLSFVGCVTYFGDYLINH